MYHQLNNEIYISGRYQRIFPYYGTRYERKSLVQNRERKITSAKSLAQNHERKNTSAKFERNFTNAKLEILYSGNFSETLRWEISWKLYAGKFLGNYITEKFLGNYTLGNFLETVCW